MNTPSEAAESRKLFQGGSPRAAREAASEWLRDFSLHGPLEISSIRVSEEGAKFIATVTFSEAEIAIAPRHFPDHAPAPLLQSA